MEIALSPENEAFLKELVDSGKYATQSQALEQIVSHQRAVEELRRKISVGVEQCERGQTLSEDEVFAEFGIFDERQG